MSSKSKTATSKTATAALTNGATPRKKKVSVEDLPILQEWVLASEAAEIAGVSRQYLHHSLHQFPSAARLSGFLVFRRSEVEEWARRRAVKLNIET